MTNLFTSRLMRLIALLLVSLLGSVTAVAKEGPSKSETIDYIEMMVAKYGKCAWKRGLAPHHSNSHDGRIEMSIDISEQYVQIEMLREEKMDYGGGQLEPTKNRYKTSFKLSDIDDFEIDSVRPGHNPCQEAEIHLICANLRHCITTEHSSFKDEMWVTVEPTDAWPSNNWPSHRFRLSSYEAGGKVVNAIRHLKKIQGAKVKVPTEEDLFEAFEPEGSSLQSGASVSSHQQSAVALARKQQVEAARSQMLESAQKQAEEHSYETYDAPTQTARTQSYDDSSGYDNDYEYDRYEEDPQPLSGADLLSEVGRIIGQGSQDIQEQVWNDNQSLAQTAADYEAQQEAERQRRLDEQRRINEQRQRAEEQRRWEQQQEAERQRQEQERQREREREEALKHPDNIVGSWMSDQYSSGGFGGYRIQGQGGNYSGTFSGRAKTGDAPLRSFSTPIRNLTLSHRGWWNEYVGEVNCDKWRQDLGFEPGGVAENTWERIQITYYPPDSALGEPAKLKSTWGCHFAADPPDMTKQ